MELREFAERLVHADTLEGKFFQPAEGLKSLTDHEPGPPKAWNEPARPADLQIAPKRKRKKLPHPDSYWDPNMRIRALHAFANHELMAVELMAWALLAYPDAPPQFRAGLVRLIDDEQRHLKMYIDRIEEMGAKFGDLPVNDHFWRCADRLTDPLKWVCAMNLTFEQGNLDHAPLYEGHFRRAEDFESAAIMQVILHDEIHHVGFGVHWLKEYTKDSSASMFETYIANLTFHNDVHRGRGQVEFNAEARRKAGLDEDFIRQVKQSPGDK